MLRTRARPTGCPCVPESVGGRTNWSLTAPAWCSTGRGTPLPQPPVRGGPVLGGCAAIRSGPATCSHCGQPGHLLEGSRSRPREPSGAGRHPETKAPVPCLATTPARTVLPGDPGLSAASTRRWPRHCRRRPRRGDGVGGWTMPSRYSSEGVGHRLAGAGADLGIRLWEIPSSRRSKVPEALAGEFAERRRGGRGEPPGQGARSILMGCRTSTAAWCWHRQQSEMSWLLHPVRDMWRLRRAQGCLQDAGVRTGPLAQPGARGDPVATIAKPPSAELRTQPVGTDSLPPMDLLDRVLRPNVERTWPSTTSVSWLRAGLVERVTRMVDRTSTSAPIRPGVKITPKALAGTSPADHQRVRG